MMLKRIICIMPVVLMCAPGVANEPAGASSYQSAFLHVEWATDQPALVALDVDSLGKRKLSANSLRPPVTTREQYGMRRVGRKIEYRAAGAPPSEPPAWSFEFSPQQMRLTSFYSANNPPPPPLVWNFSPRVSRATLLGLMNDDGSDGFQIYENGGATACYAYFTLAALYKLGRRNEADAILFPMLKAFEDGGFQGEGQNGRSYDWKAWDGTPYGYEGLLVDGYMTLLAVLSR
jgi:hypothetical protein